MQAIVTKWFGPTNNAGSRVKASCDAGSVTIPWDHALNFDENHAAAARALLVKVGWDGEWIGGSTPQRGNDLNFAFVCVSHGSPVKVRI